VAVIFPSNSILTEQSISDSMNMMNENRATIQLLELMDRKDGWGNVEGKAVASKIMSFVDEHPSVRVFEISLKGLERNDASFARESVIAVAKRYRGEKGFFLTHLKSKDLLDNWKAGAEALLQPVNVITDRLVTIGPVPSKGLQDVLDYVNSASKTTASEVARKLRIQVTNASTKLNMLREKGYILRKELTAPSGGREFEYSRIR